MITHIQNNHFIFWLICARCYDKNLLQRRRPGCYCNHLLFRVPAIHDVMVYTYIIEQQHHGTRCREATGNVAVNTPKIMRFLGGYNWFVIKNYDLNEGVVSSALVEEDNKTLCACDVFIWPAKRGTMLTEQEECQRGDSAHGLFAPRKTATNWK